MELGLTELINIKWLRAFAVSEDSNFITFLGIYEVEDRLCLGKFSLVNLVKTNIQYFLFCLLNFETVVQVVLKDF